MNERNAPPQGGTWPEPRVRALEVEELYRFAGPAAAFSYFGALLTLGVLIETGDTTRGSLWFVWATAVTILRFASVAAYRQRPVGSDPETWARLIIAANLLSGIQWGMLGTVLFAAEPGYRAVFTIMVIICFVSGSVTAYSPVRGAHEALSVPATFPTAIYVFFIHDGIHLFAGVGALFFCLAILYYAWQHNRHIVSEYRLKVERDELLDLTAVLNEKLQAENRELAHRAAMRGASVTSARERAGRLEALFENSPVAQIECDAAGNVFTCNHAAERLFHMKHGEIVGRPFASFLVGSAAWDGSFQGVRDPMSRRVDIRSREGSLRPYLAAVTPLPAAEGLKPGFVVALTALEEPAEVK